MTALEMTNVKFNQTAIMSDSIDDTIFKANIAKRRWQIVAVTSIFITVLSGFIFVAILLYKQLNADIVSCPFKVISRNDWTAQPPEEPAIPLDLPVSRVIIAHTNTASCTTEPMCKLVVRSIQADHIEIQKLDDIAFNFLIGGNGVIFNGRGWNVEGRHTIGFNDKSICIAMVGTFNDVLPSILQLDAAHRLIIEGVRLDKITADYSLYAQRQLMNTTDSPGRQLSEMLKSWSHWTAEIK